MNIHAKLYKKSVNFRKLTKNGAKIISNQNKLNNIDLILFLISLMDSSHFTHQLWSAEHVMNPNIKEVIDIFSVILGYMGHFFDLEISDTAGSAVKASA